MKVTIKTIWFEMVIPKRCRKPRPQEFSTNISVNIREVKSEKAPIAFLVDTFERGRREVRLYQGKLYRQFQDYVESKNHKITFVNQTIDTMQWDWWLRPRFSAPDYPITFEDIKNDVMASSKKFIIVNGNVYEKCGVPYYFKYFTNFGVINNHQGFTGLFVAFAPINKNEIIYGWSPIDKEKAIEDAKLRAINESYSKLIDTFDSSDNIEVLIPTAIKGKFLFSKNTQKLANNQ